MKNLLLSFIVFTGINSHAAADADKTPKKAPEKIAVKTSAKVLEAKKIVWLDDVEAALKLAESQGKPLLIDFYADWCGPCKKLDKETLKANSVQPSLEGYVLLKVNTDNNESLVQRFKISGIPRLIVLNKFNEKVADQTGFISADMFRNWLKENKQHAFSQVRVTAFSQAEKDLLVKLKAGKASIADAQQAIDLHESMLEEKKRTWMLELIQQGKIQPKIWLPQLQAEQLQQRLLAAMILKNALGEKFSFDAWANEQKRAADYKILLENFSK